ncbi:MAG: hypothetical protein R3F05_13010 [Planctomycetota bacterium]
MLLKSWAIPLAISPSVCRRCVLELSFEVCMPLIGDTCLGDVRNDYQGGARSMAEGRARTRMSASYRGWPPSVVTESVSRAMPPSARTRPTGVWWKGTKTSRRSHSARRSSDPPSRSRSSSRRAASLETYVARRSENGDALVDLAEDLAEGHGQSVLLGSAPQAVVHRLATAEQDGRGQCPPNAGTTSAAPSSMAPQLTPRPHRAR